MKQAGAPVIMTSCIGWLLDVAIDKDHAILWIKTEDRQILKLRDACHPGFYILPRNEPDNGLSLFQILSRQQDILVKKVSWEENKFTNLFDYHHYREKLICVQLQSLRYYTPLLKRLKDDYRVKQLFNTDLSYVQQYLFRRLRIEPTSKVKVEYNGSKILEITKVDDEQQISPPHFSLLYLDLYTNSGILALDDTIRLIKVRYEEDYYEKKREAEDISFQNTEEKTILKEFSNYILAKNPDIIICMGDYHDNNNNNSSCNSKVLQYLFARAKKIGFDLQLGRDEDDDDNSNTSESSLTHKIKGRICISSNYRQTTYFDQFGFAGLIERARFGFLPLDMAARYSINRLIDSRNCYELIQRGFVIPNKNNRSETSNNNNHEHIRTVEQIVSGDKGGMIISPQIGLHENVVALDYDSEYANLIVNHNLSYETVTSKGVVIQSNKEKKGLLPTVVEGFLKRRVYFKGLLKELPKDSIEYVWCEQRVNSLKNILVCLYGSTGSIWNRHGNVLTFEEINRISRDVLIKTKDIVQQLGYELVYADTDSVFIKRKKDSSARDYNEVIDTLSKATGLSISIDYHYKFLVLLPLEAGDEKIEVLKHYFGITQEGEELVVRGIETRRHDIPNFIKQFQTQLLYALFEDCKDSVEVVNKGYEKALLLVTKAIDKIMTGEDIHQQDLVISKLLRQDIEKYKSLFPHVSAAIQLSSNNSRASSKYPPLKGDTIQYIYTNSQHNNPLCRVVAIEEENIVQSTQEPLLLEYDKEKYREMVLDATETVLGIFGFDRTSYDSGNFSSNNKNKVRRRKKWYEELREGRMKDIRTEMS